MSRIATSYLALAGLYLIVGLTLGIGMGIAHDFRLAPVHGHINMVGWTSHALMGMAYRQWPEMARTSLAASQFLIFALSAPIFMAGLVLSIGYEQPIVAIAGSVGVFLGGFLFALIAARVWLGDKGV